MRKSHIWLIIATVLVVVVSVGVTVALLVASSKPVINTFTIGGVSITLTETTTEYKMAPGVTVAKDPTVTVLANSERSWLFVKVEKTNDFDTFCTYEIQDGWTALEGQAGVYYKLVETSTSDQRFPVLKNNCVHIKDTLTEEQLNAVTVNPTLVVTAYAIQDDGLETAAAAWRALNQ
jgi:hypothetical protein